MDATNSNRQIPDLVAIPSDRAELPRIRIENLSSQVVLVGRELTISGRIFIPDGWTGEVPKFEVLLERLDRDDGTFSAGLHLYAEALLSCSPPNLIECSVDRVEPRRLDTFFSIAGGGIGEMRVAGRWYAFESRLLFPELLDTAQRFHLYVAQVGEFGLVVSNSIVVRQERLAEVVTHWWPREGEPPLLRATEQVSYFGYILFSADSITEIRLLDGDRAVGELSFVSATDEIAKTFAGIDHTQITAVSVYCRPDEIPFAIEVPLHLKVTLINGDSYTLSMNRLVARHTELENLSEVESMYLDDRRRICISGWCLPPSATEGAKFYLQTRKENFEIPSIQLRGSSFERHFRHELEFIFPQRTQTEPWGYSLRFYPQLLGGSHGVPQLFFVSESKVVATAMLTWADREKLASLLQQAQAPSTGFRRIAKRVIAQASRQISYPTVPAPSPRIEEPSGFPKRIIFATHSLSSTEGAPRVLFNLVQSLIKQHRTGREILVLSSSPGPLQDELEALGVGVEVVEQLHSSAFSRETFRSAYSAAQGIVRQFGADFIYANTIGAFWAMELGSDFALPTLWSIHESKKISEWGLEVAPYYAQKIQCQLAQAKHVVFVAESTRNLLAAHLVNAQTSVIPNGIDLAAAELANRTWTQSQARATLGISDSATVISIIGTTTYRKGQDVFIHAMAELFLAMPEREFCFLVVGGRNIPFLSELQRLQETLGLQETLRIVPETREVVPYFRASDVIALCSREESAPLVSLESFAYEKPLVSTAVFGLAEQLQDKSNCLVFPVNDSLALAKQVQRLLEDRSLADRLIAGGIETLRERFMLETAMLAHEDRIVEAWRSCATTMRQ